jgi:hypothetical protein
MITIRMVIPIYMDIMNTNGDDEMGLYELYGLDIMNRIWFMDGTEKRERVENRGGGFNEIMFFVFPLFLTYFLFGFHSFRIV